MRLRQFIVISFALLLIGCEPADLGPLTCEPPSGWKVSFDQKKNEYTLRKPKETWLHFNIQHPSVSPAKFPALLSEVAEKFKVHALSGKLDSKNTKVSFSNEEMRLEVLHGKSVIGNYVLFDELAGNKKFSMAVFIFKINSTVWTGQFFGEPENWDSALKILQDIHQSPPKK